MRAGLVPALIALAACGGAPRPSIEAETAAVYEVFLDQAGVEIPGPVLLQDSEAPATAAMFDDAGAHPPREISRGLSAEVREAVQDLVSRGGTPGRLPANLVVGNPQSRISADSAGTLIARIQASDLERLPDRASIVRLSAVGFNRERTVAVLYQGVACGSLCGQATGRVLRKHPGGWMMAEELFWVIS